MKGRLALVLVLLALLVAFALLFFTTAEAPKNSIEKGPETAEKPIEKSGERPSLMPQKFPDNGTAKEEVDPAESRFAMKVETEPALSGIEFAPSTDEDRTRAGVTDQYGRGVTITRMHPDSSAAEVKLEIGDVIVRAQKESVNSVEDLKRIVGDRDHTVVNFMRDGQLMSVVLQKPFKKSAP